MKLEEYQEKLKLSYENSLVSENIHELMELFCDFANLKSLSYYKFEYEYNDFFHKFDILTTSEDANSKKTYKLLLRNRNTIYGYLLINQKIKSSPILKKLISKIIKYLKKGKELEKKIFENELPFNIYLFHEIELNLFAQNLKAGLEGLFNIDVVKDISMEKYFDALKSKDKKHIIIFLVDSDKMLKKHEEKIKVLNELIIVIGPNDHNISIHSGKLGIEYYIPINEFKTENLKEIILSKKNAIFNKNKFGNKIIAVGGISGGIGSTTIAMNMSDLISRNVPDKNLLYVDLSTTKAISNLFLEDNPLPQKSIIDLINSNEFNLENNLENGLIKKRENFYCVTGIQKHIDKEFLEKDIFIEKLLDYISTSSSHFNFIIIDTGTADASNLKSTIYDIVSDFWLVTEMALPHISKLKTFYSLMKRAGLKEKISFIVNRYDSQNTISITDATSILNMTADEKSQFENFKIPNDYSVLGKCWNYCELASTNHPNSSFVKKLDSILQEKNFYKKDAIKEKKGNIFSSFFAKDKN